MLQVRPQATSQDVFGHQVWKVFKEHLSIIDSELRSKGNRVGQSLQNYMLHQRPLFPFKSNVFASHPNHLNDSKSKHHQLLQHLLLIFPLIALAASLPRKIWHCARLWYELGPNWHTKYLGPLGGCRRAKESSPVVTRIPPVVFRV